MALERTGERKGKRTVRRTNRIRRKDRGEGKNSVPDLKKTQS